MPRRSDLEGRHLTLNPKCIKGTLVEVRHLSPPEVVKDPGYDMVWPIGDGNREKWMETIDTIFMRGVPRALRQNGRVYLLQGRDIFWSAPVVEILTDTDRLSDITGKRHGTEGPSLIVDLDKGLGHKKDATKIPPAPGTLWHNRQGLKYVTKGCRQVVRIGPKQPKGAMKARSSAEVALERALARHLPVELDARRICVHDEGLRQNIEVDIFVPALKLVVEYDGEYWHKENRSIDALKSNRLRSAGLRVIRVRENLPVTNKDWDVRVKRNSTSDDRARAVLDVLKKNGVKTKVLGLQRKSPS